MNVNTPCELRIRLTEKMANDLEKMREYTGMDYTNMTRMAIVEFINNHINLEDR